uniref:Aldo/keto reductase n=1 Tax=Ignisphaera aggregans TaxID=334771 RepID=A0A7J3QG72_9CREN
MPRFNIDINDCKPLGKSNECISAIGIGTRNIHNYRNAEEALSIAIEAGINLFETAGFYGDGLSEELIGRTISKFGRENIFIVTKLLPQYLANEESAIKAVQASLKRLRTSYVDLLLVYGTHEVISIAYQIRLLEMLIEKGYTRYIGVGNFKIKELKEAMENTRKYDIVANQVAYSVVNKRIEKDLIPFAIKNNILILACSPLEKGSIIRHPLLIKIASNYNKTPIQIALNFIISRPYVVAITKTEQKNHVREIKNAMGWRLQVSDIELLEHM